MSTTYAVVVETRVPPSQPLPLRSHWWIVDLYEKIPDILPGSRGFPLDRHGFRFRIGVDALDAIQFPQLPLNGHHTVIAADILYLNGSAMHIQPPRNFNDVCFAYYITSVREVNVLGLLTTAAIDSALH